MLFRVWNFGSFFVFSTNDDDHNREEEMWKNVGGTKNGEQHHQQQQKSAALGVEHAAARKVHIYRPYLWSFCFSMMRNV